MPVHRFHIKWISAYLFQSIKTPLSRLYFTKSIQPRFWQFILVHALLELSTCDSSVSTSQSGKGSQLAKHLKHEFCSASQNAPATAATDELEKSALAQRKYFNSFFEWLLASCPTFFRKFDTLFSRLRQLKCQPVRARWAQKERILHLFQNLKFTDR